MIQYIDKSALVAEIEERKGMCYNHYGDYWNGCYNTFTDILSFIDTLEVKEVDLEKEIDNVWNPHFNLGWDDNSLVSINHKSFESIAKHFFELGLKVQKGE